MVIGPTEPQAIHELSGIYESFDPIILVQFSQLKTEQAISLLHSLKLIMPHAKLFIFYYLGDVFGPFVDKVGQELFQQLKTSAPSPLYGFFINQVKFEKILEF